jgi:hypothetical protein
VSNFDSIFIIVGLFPINNQYGTFTGPLVPKLILHEG